VKKGGTIQRPFSPVHAGRGANHYASSKSNPQKSVLCNQVMKLKLPQYSGKDYLVLAVMILPFTIIMNFVIFGQKYFSGIPIFLLATFITSVSFCLFFILCGGIAVLLKKRFPSEEQTGHRLIAMILTFVTMTGLFLLLIFRGYEAIGFFGYTFNQKGFTGAYICMGIINIFLTLLFEGIARYENWKINFNETEQLKKTFKQSQLLGLKSQLNPHFLFNSLNSLSSLINEDEEHAEKFLDEMSKVYRYMLRNDDEQLVTLETELKFIDSYLFLLKSRFGDGLEIITRVSEPDKEKFIPPLTLQVIIERAFTQNTVQKNSPLKIFITTSSTGMIVIKNNTQVKQTNEPVSNEEGIENLVLKYQLLNQPPVIIEQDDCNCCIFLPLIDKKEEVTV